MLKAVSLSEEHLEDTALLVSNRYQRLRQQVPHLPHSYADVTKLLPLLQKILSASGIEFDYTFCVHLLTSKNVCANIGA